MGYTEKRTVATDVKRRIAEKAASLIPEGSIIFLDVGTTVEAVAQALTEKRALRVFTSSLAAAGTLAGRPGIDLFVLGGAVRGIDGSIASETTLSMLTRFRSNYAVIGFSGIDRYGAPMDYDLEKVAVNQVALDQSKRALVVGDSSKFRKFAVASFATGSRSLIFATEAPPPEAISENLLGELVVMKALSRAC